MASSVGNPTDAILGASPRICSLRDDIRRLAAFDVLGNPHVPTVLLQGETGTGKGLVARAMHESGPRAAGPFVDVNCGAIPDTMLEAELFGYEAGAFTDAKRSKPGLFEAASRGTLFLDEVDALSRPVQSKLLKAIEEKRIRRLGAVEARDVDVKLIAATQADLQRLVAAGEFRADLYHRLAVLILDIPPLRDRQDDVELLATHYLAIYARAHGLSPKRLTADGRAWLRAHPWPGNVRELGHLLERVTLLGTSDVIDADSLARLAGGEPAPARSAAEPVAAASQAEISDEEARIRSALARTGGNVVRAAKLLGLGRNGLRYRMRRLGIGRPEEDELGLPSPPPQEQKRPPAEPSGEPHSPSWEQKATAVLVVSLAFPHSPDAAGFDPWTQATRWQRLVCDTIEGFGGRLAERSPSRCTAVFGLPRAEEQTAQRAVQAAMAIQRSVRSGKPPCPDVRTAVHVGEVQIDVNAPDPLARLFPIADTFALAERLLGHAGAGEVLVSAQAARRIDRSFELRPRELRLGADEEDRYAAHAIVRQLPPGGGGRLLGESGFTPFVGRERELGVLMDGFERTTAGQGQVIFVAGDAGMGKSRLLSEFARRIQAVPHRWIEGRCASYGTFTPFLPLADGIRRYLEIDDQDDGGSASAKIARELERLGPEVAWTLPYLRQTLSLSVEDQAVESLDAASRRSEMFRALRTLVARAAEIEPLVLVIEDLHWIDQASEEYLLFLEDVVPTSRVLLVLSHRSGYQAPFPDRSYHQRIALPPLTSGDMAAMTGSILGAAEIPPELRSLIVAKAEGNPFFVEELAKSLLEEGSLSREDDRVVLARPLDEVSVPDTVQDVLLARIDRLAEESRRAIQIASVIGREFALRLLARLTEAGDSVREQVDELRSLELIYEKALHPELAYMFKHALTHDVAYESVVVERRRALHCSIGRVIEEVYADRLAEHYETLAHHYGRGGDLARALHYHHRSAEKAAEAHANRAVTDHCRAALALVDQLGASVAADVRRRLNELLGLACFHLSEFAASGAAYEEAASCSDSGEARSLNLGAAALSHFWAHRYDTAQRCIGAARDVARREGVPAGEALALVVRGFYRGVHDADIEGLEQDLQTAMEIAEREKHELVETFARVYLAMKSEWTGDYASASQRAESAIVLGRRLRRPELIIFPGWFLAKARCCTGDFGGAIALLEEAYHLCDRIGDRAWKSRLLNTLGWCFAEIGHHEQARGFNERAAILAREIGDPEILSNADINLAMNHLELGDVERACAYLRPIEEAVSIPGDPWMRWRYAMHVHHARGCIELTRGHLDEALASAHAQLVGAERHRAPKVVGRARTLAARALIALDRRPEAEHELREALAVAERIGHRSGVWEAELQLRELAVRSGDQARAERHLGRARVALEGAAGSLADGPLRRMLLRRTEG